MTYRDGREGHVRKGPTREGLPRPVSPPRSLDEEGRPERPKVKSATSSPLKRLEEEEKEQQRRRESVHVSLRLTVMGVVILGLFSVMLVRLWSLQVLQGSKYREVANRLATRDVPISPPRGLILARDGTVMVGDKVEPVVTLNRQIALSDPAVVGRLAVELNVTVAQIKTDLANQQDSIYEPVPVAVGVPESVIVYLAEHHSEFPGVAVSYEAERTYPYGNLAAQTLGYVADITAAELKQFQKYGYLPSDVMGQAGVEAEYDRYLHGRTGEEVIKVDAQGIPVGTPTTRSPLGGDDVVLNMDLGLQKEVQSALANQLVQLKSQGLPVSNGAAVVLDPQNGAVLAMASLPSYNPAWWVGGISESHYKYINSVTAHEPSFNRAVQGGYTPGSTFKLATATAALNDGLISPYSTIDDTGSFTIPNCTGGAGCTFYNNAGEVLGPIDVSMALTASDDVFFYTLGYDFWAQRGKYGDMAIQRWAERYGFGEPTGIDLPPSEAYDGQVDSLALRKAQHEAAPKAFPYVYYGAGDNVNMAFGQGETLVSPLQLANAYATFANGGTRYAPELAAGVVSPTGRVVKVIKPRVMGHVPLPSSTYQAIFSGLVGVITNAARGTAGSVFSSATNPYPYSKLPLAGKTGTATTSTNPNAQPSALFVAFGPAIAGDPSAAKYVVAVVIPRAGYGASAAAPVARQVFQYLIKHPVGPVHLHVHIGGA
jgi:penicillin-binding protein 2